jgi:hypothetical protein
MWSGSIVPLFKPLRELSNVYKPLATPNIPDSTSYDPARQWIANEPEEMLLPLPHDICFGTGIRDGSVVHVAFQWNPPLVCEGDRRLRLLTPGPTKSETRKQMGMKKKFTTETEKWLEDYGQDVAAWIVVSPFPIEILPERIMQVIVRLGNTPGAFYEAVARSATQTAAALVQVEGMSTGDEGSLLLFPEEVAGASNGRSAADRMKDLIRTIDRNGEGYLREFSARVPAAVIAKWEREIAKETGKGTRGVSAPLDSLISKVFKSFKDCKRLTGISNIGWLEEIVNPESRYVKRVDPENNKSPSCGQSVWKMKSRKVTVRDRMIMVPWGEITRGYRDARWASKEMLTIGDDAQRSKRQESQKKRLEDAYDILQPIPQYALLIRDPDLPVVIGVIPQRMLFQVKMRLRSSGMLSAYEKKVGVGAVEAVCEVMDKSGSNIWHIQQLPSNMTFTERVSGNKPAWECSFIESDLRIVAACPPEWRYADAKSLQEYFKRLRRNLAQVKLPRLRVGGELKLGLPDNVAIKAVLEKVIKELNERAETAEKKSPRRKPSKKVVWADDKPIEVKVLLQEWPNISKIIRDWLGNEVSREGHNVEKEDLERCEVWLKDTLNEFGEPLVSCKQDIEIHAPPLLRVFFSHSASPDDAEKDHIDQIKDILQKYAVAVEEGQFSAGLSTEELSRGRIRLCSTLVSFFWPRDEFVDREGSHIAAEWITHEESFALGLGLRLIRILESSVRRPRYEYDRPTIGFALGDNQSWQRAKKKLESELREFVLVEAQRFLSH